MALLNPIWITLAPILTINLLLLTSYLVYVLWISKRRNIEQFESAKRHSSALLSTETKQWWLWTTDPIVKCFVKMRMGPNAITMLGFLVSTIAAYFFARGWFGYAGWTMILGATFDIFDGRVARLTNSSSRSGAFFDAVMDRFGEGLCFLGLCIAFRESPVLPIAIAALIGSQLVSYTKARGEGVGIDCKVGWMQRPERIVYLGVASVFDPLMGVLLSRWWAVPPPILIMIALGFIALMTNVTAIHRMIYIMNALDTEDKREKESIPQIITRLSTPGGREQMWERARYGYDRSRAVFSHVILFLIGGIPPALLREALRRGDLPHIARHLEERGSLVDAVSSFPSSRGIGGAAFVTGNFPGTCNIPGMRWFDRTVRPGRVLSMNRFRDYEGWGAYAMDYDLAKSVSTIFEYSRQAVNIFGMLNRGCGLIRDPAFFRMHRRYNMAKRPEDVEKAREAAFYWFSSALHRETDFVLYQFPPLHAVGEAMRSQEVMEQALRKIDEDVGRSVAKLQDLGMYDETALLLAGDHTFGHAKRSFDLDAFLGKRFQTCSQRRRIGEWHQAEAIALPTGTSMAHLSIRSGESWEAGSFFEEIEKRGLVGALLEQEELDMLAGRSVEGGIVVQSRRGRAHLLEDVDGRITYLAKSGDPFGLKEVPQVLDAHQAFEITARADHPDGIMQMLQLFRSRRTGDLVVSARGDVVLTASQEASDGWTHGSLSAEHSVVPFLSSVPLQRQMVRTVDVFAHSLQLLGIEPMHALDGAFSEGAASDALQSAMRE